MSLLDFSTLRSLLGRGADDPEVINVIESTEHIRRASYLGYVELKDKGVAVMFAADTAAEEEPVQSLHVSAFHLHRKGHDGYAQYSGELPSKVAFNDQETDVLKKLGKPVESGGGEKSSFFKRPVPRWLRYSIGNVVVHLQLDAKARIEMVTLYPANAKLGAFPA
jgi:hypothetical protein